MKNTKWRLFLIIGLAVICAIKIWPPHKKLKGGIDLLGGTSLLYEIDETGMERYQGNLAQDMATVLKRRVDPDGVRNLIWRPQGKNRLEIQMPRPPAGAKEIRQRYQHALLTLREKNLKLSSVREAALTGNDKRLAEIKKQFPDRKKEIDAYAKALVEFTAARKSKNLDRLTAATVSYRKARRALQQRNLDIVQLGHVLDLDPVAPERKKQLDAIEKAHPKLKDKIAELQILYRAWSDQKGPLDDPEDLKRLLRGSGVLEFRILPQFTNNRDEFAEQITQLKKQGPIRRVESGPYAWFQIKNPEDFKPERSIVEPYAEKSYVLCFTSPEKTLLHKTGRDAWRLAGAMPDRDQSGYPAISFRFDERGARYFYTLTSSNKDKPLCILLDGVAYSAPNIQQAIRDRGIITGNFTQKEVIYLVNTLRAGSLPAKLKQPPISEKTIGPSLGRDNLIAGFRAAVIGLAAVLIIMAVYYFFAGLVANVALALNLLFLLGAMSMLGATFTLPGVAGVILTLGMAVDANVLIYERIREESAKGSGLRMAVQNGYRRAFNAIIDSNITTIITSAILYYVGSEEIKGFGITLMLGLIISLFTSLFVTRTIFTLLIDLRVIRKLPMLKLIGIPNVDWNRLRRYFLPISLAAVILGWVLFIVRGNEIYDIELAGGTSITFRLKDGSEMDVSRVREKVARIGDELESPAIRNATIYAIGSGKNQYEIVTAETDHQRLKDAIESSFADVLAIRRPLQYDKKNVTVAPIIEPTRLIDARELDLSDYQGGVSITIKGIRPAVSLADLKGRLEAMRSQPEFEKYQWRDFKVFGLAGHKKHPEHFSEAMVVVADPNYDYANYRENPGLWKEEFRDPEVHWVTTALQREQSLEKITKFAPQVAQRAQIQAWLAIGLAVIAIVAYIWIRFGSVRYGLGAIAAAVHDVSLIIGFIALSVWLGQTVVGHFLMIDDFKINLAMIAALLTIIGYSINDSIVVYDRIRENRGKLANVTSRIINDSINQTMARTIMTSFTTLTVVTIMYIWGGPGIHGFNYAFLIGILVGTYSSIAIAAPLLLFQVPRWLKRSSGE